MPLPTPLPAHAISLDRESLTELGDALIFADLFKHAAVFDVRLNGWRIFQDNVWKHDTANNAGLLMESSMLARRDTAVAANNAPAFAYAVKGHNHYRLNNALHLARNKLSDSGDRWDTDHDLLGAPNGVIDLRTGTLRAGTPTDRITRTVAVAYDPSATCPLWDHTLAQIFPVNTTLIVDWLQRAVGYSLTGDTSEEIFFILYGTGRNGKGTVINTLAAVCGDYAVALDAKSLQRPRYQQSGEGPSPEMAKLPAARFVTASEFAGKAPLHEARLKQLTGRDSIVARPLYGAPFSFLPQLKLWLSMDQPPQAMDASDGFWQRVRLLPFRVSFAGHEDYHLKDRLKTETAGILAWAVRGTLAWRARGLSVDLPHEITRATADLKAENEPTFEFIDAYYVKDAAGIVATGVLYAGYQSWHATTGQPGKALSLNGFGRSLARQYEPVTVANVRGYRGLRVKTLVDRR